MDAWKVKPTGVSKLPSLPLTAPSPPIELVIPEHTTVEEFAALLHQTRFRIVGDLMKLNIFMTVEKIPDYETITKVALIHGFIAMR